MKKLNRHSRTIADLKYDRVKPLMRSNPLFTAELFDGKFQPRRKAAQSKSVIRDIDIEIVSDNTTDIDMATSDLEVKIDRIPDKMNKAMQQACVDVVKHALKECECTGVWSIRELKRDTNKGRNTQLQKLQGKDIALEGIVGLKGQSGSGIRMLIQTGHQRTAVYHGTLTSPDVKISTVYYKLAQTYPAKKVDGVPQSKALPEPTPVIHETRVTQVGEKHLGKIAFIKHDGVLVTIFPNNPSDSQHAWCPIINLDNVHTPSGRIGDNFRVGHQIYVQIVGVNDKGIPIACRKMLLPQPDGFSMEYVDGTDTFGRPNKQWNMDKFTDSEERMLIALDIVRNAIEQNATDVAWAKAATDHQVVGGVFLEDSDHASAPAPMVKHAVANDIILRWGLKFAGKPNFVADADIRVSPLLRTLTERGYIISTHDRVNGKPKIIAFCMMEEGYQYLGLQPPNAQVLVKQPPVKKPVVEKPVVKQPVIEKPVIEKPVIEPVVEQPVVEQPVIEQPIERYDIDDIRNRLAGSIQTRFGTSKSNTLVKSSTQDINRRVSNTIGTPAMPKTEPHSEIIEELFQPPTAVIEEDDDSVLKLIKEYKTNDKRKTELDQIIADCQKIIAERTSERDGIVKWLTANAAVGETLRLSKNINK